MSQKDYVAIVQAIRESRRAYNLIDRARLVNALIKYMLSDNPRFDAHRFEDAVLAIEPIDMTASFISDER